MTFEESKQVAINEAIELNRKVGFYRWKTVSMDMQGYWFADECRSLEMEFGLSFYKAPYGKDIVLSVRCNEVSRDKMRQSVSSVPNMF